MVADVVDVVSSKNKQPAACTDGFIRLPLELRAPGLYLKRQQIEVGSPKVFAHFWVLDDDPWFLDHVLAFGNLKMAMDLGFARTSMGGILVSLTRIMSVDETEVFGTYQGTFNPDDGVHLSTLSELLRQPTWYLALLGPSHRLLRAMVYENTFGLVQAFDNAKLLSLSWPVIDFQKAVAEFDRFYSIWDLIDFSETEDSPDKYLGPNVPPVVFFPYRLTLEGGARR
jgi:hypothetical protein